MNPNNATGFGWAVIVRLGLVQAAIGAIVVLATSTMNRVMVVELALPASIPGLLVALHYAIQMMRPKFGHGSDVGGNLKAWIGRGMAVLAIGGVAAAASVGLMASARTLGILAAFAAFSVIGVGVGASGTALLVLLSQGVAPQRRPAAATITWVMMIAGFVLTTAVVGHLLTPYSAGRLLTITWAVAASALLVTTLALWGIPAPAAVPATPAANRVVFVRALREVWRESTARRFAIFVFVSMLAYSGQELIFEPFAGTVFHLTPAQSARLASLQHGGALVGMILVGLLASRLGRKRGARLTGWAIAGCAGSAAALLALAGAAVVGAGWPLRANTFALGLANGVFAVSAIGAMMTLAAEGAGHQGLRMGLWGAAQAVAFALGGLLSSGAVDLTRLLFQSALLAYGAVFAAQAVLFLFAIRLCACLSVRSSSPTEPATGNVAGSLGAVS